jgi:hypothetical protein
VRERGGGGGREGRRAGGREGKRKRERRERESVYVRAREGEREQEKEGEGEFGLSISRKRGWNLVVTTVRSSCSEMSFSQGASRAERYSPEHIACSVWGLKLLVYGALSG